jgi:hypothetical protein
MNGVGRRWAASTLATLAAFALLATARTSAADSRRVAAVDPDQQLARALEVALSPWGATVLQMHIEGPGATMPIAVDRARAIARDARADVLVWVSASDGGHALWIYDVASDHASAREIDAAPPFEPATAAAVALAVKTLLRGTVVAPLPERFGAAVRVPSWLLGASGGVGWRFGTPALTEARLGLHASIWPAALGHRWGAYLEAEGGSGAQAQSNAFSGTLGDAALRLGIGLRVPLADWATFEPSLGGGLHLLTLDGAVLADGSHVSVHRLDGGFEPRLAVSFTLLGGRLLLTPWFGMTVLGRWQRFLVHDTPVVDVGPLAAQAALRVALVVP